MWNQLPSVSVVGSRTPAPDTSMWLQRELSSFVRSKRVVIVSGGAARGGSMVAPDRRGGAGAYGVYFSK
ncbi:MAG: hypothetical protein HC902_03010 [Calothrix sp. SM1_5_4]|nr:hypothetical protein [Calothrix sp. SM1_5_4]